MADRAEPEGWGVRYRFAVVTAVLVPLGLLLLLVVSGWYYMTVLRPPPHRMVTPFPAPGLESSIHSGTRDPDLPQPRPKADPRIDAAAKAVAREGLGGWPPAR